MGINAIFSYSFTLGASYFFYCYGIVNFVACLLNVLFVVDRISRRINVIFGLLLMVVVLVILAIFIGAKQ